MFSWWLHDNKNVDAYPDLFAAAMINCPALDVADARGGETPTDDRISKY